ncbi:DNA repair ATPase [Chitinivorax sp. B]|uniref:DNA repair ATPase n=1 Tax=Chitinivorax sp. B TaxID=2502235 RepID=UPI0010F9570A|nr:DNA repair ATPase [Chitinivorax sp. B]
MSEPQENLTELAGGSYDLLRQRLNQQGEMLLTKAGTLNEARLAEFGREDMRLIRRIRARTENNCVARDLVRVGPWLLFGYNVFIGLKKETRIEDVFSLYQLVEGNDGDELIPSPFDGTFLADQRFTADFRELYAYYKQATLVQLRVHNDKLLVAFKIGQQITDIRVFRWALAPDGKIAYIDNRGERDIQLPPTHDFEWTTTTREDHVNGKHPHINILDTVFVETIGGDLTIKIENNTESGLGIFSEPVDDRNQSLADADVAYARLGALILLRIKPYREDKVRYLVYNQRTQTATRIDEMGESCVQLPEDHGIIFPGGYYLQSGESKRFDTDAAGMRFKRMARSPNGEDVLYVFYEPVAGKLGLFSYNLIDKQLSAPIYSNGYARFADGRILLFIAESDEPTRTHPMQLWQTPFCNEEFASSKAIGHGFFGRIGNGELVRGLSELYGIARAVREQCPSRHAYEDLIKHCARVQDSYFWLDAPETGQLASELKAIGDTARATLDEFDKITSIRREAAKLLTQAEAEQKALNTDIASALWHSPGDFVVALDKLRAQRGRLLTLKEARYIDLDRISQLDVELTTEQTRIADKTIRFLAQDTAFDSYRNELAKTATQLPTVEKTVDLAPILAQLDQVAHGLDLLTELLGTLAAGDATLRTRILDAISGVYAEVNRLRAEARKLKKQLAETESAAEFGAQFKLFGQSIANALDLADSPEKCDEAMTRLLTQLEELEGQFGEQDAFIADIAIKREAVYEAFSGRKQTLLDERQKRAGALFDAASRILAGIPKRVVQLSEQAQLHAYFASDALILKLKGLIGELRKLGDAVHADDLESQLKTARENAVKVLRDRTELMGEGGNVIRLGKHAFTVNVQPLDLTLVPKEGALAFHLTGTDYFEMVNDSVLDSLKPYWGLVLPSETPSLYRAEYLVGQLLDAATRKEFGLDLNRLHEIAADLPALQDRVRQFAAPRYQDGYQKGVHDHDAALILAALLPMMDHAGLLRYSPTARALAALYHAAIGEGLQTQLKRRAHSAEQLHAQFGQDQAINELRQHTVRSLARFAKESGLESWSNGTLLEEAGEYLVAELASPQRDWTESGNARDLADGLIHYLEHANLIGEWRDTLQSGSLNERWLHASHWLQGYATAHAPQAVFFVPEAAALLLTEQARHRVNATLQQAVPGLLGEHPLIQQGTLQINLNDFRQRLAHHRQVVLPAYEQLQALRQQLVTNRKGELKLHQFQAKPLSSFVRNRLIDEVYLPIIGDNLAKQMGTAGEARRTDLMGMLLLISPPGYGKTTLMEYLADRLGMIFVRINCPALGHDIVSLDPAQATHSAARQELEKLNLGLMMGNNVMLYLDDIQHTNPEFLQKFIALCDGTRRVEGVWHGEPRTFDLRGKRFAIVMAGNPYTESGEAFKIPDMLANRADIYNLGDVLSGREALFALSYLENSLTAHPALAPLTSRAPSDVRLFVQMAQGENVPQSEFSHAYGAAEANEIVGLFRKLFQVRDVLLQVNAAYIASAAQADAYRTEPPFKLQGSYRNMAKLTARVSAIMRDDELAALLRDHYRGEAQTLTQGAEENLLKLSEILGDHTPEEAERWATIRADFQRHKKQGGADADGTTKLANLAADMAVTLGDIAGQLRDAQGTKTLAKVLHDGLGTLAKHVPPAPQVHVQVEPAADIVDVIRGLAQAYETALLPTISAMNHKIRLDHEIWEKVQQIGEELTNLQQRITAVSKAPR